MNLKPFFQDCLWKRYFGIECPGCGMQRAFESLINGDVLGSIRLFPALLPILAMLVYLALHLRFTYRRGHRVLLVMFIINSVIITTNYIFKMFHII